MLGVQEVPGSNPGGPTNVFSDLRAFLALQKNGCRWFCSCCVHHKANKRQTLATRTCVGRRGSGVQIAPRNGIRHIQALFRFWGEPGSLLREIGGTLRSSKEQFVDCECSGLNVRSTGHFLTRIMYKRIRWCFTVPDLGHALSLSTRGLWAGVCDLLKLGAFFALQFKNCERSSPINCAVREFS